jgi:UrcA family protein
MFKLILALGIGISTMAAAPFDERVAVADKPNSVVIGIQRVNYGDIDINTNVGADRFLRRAQRAANAACGLSFSERYEAVASVEQRCVQSLLEQTVARLASDVLDDLYVRRSQPFGFAVSA